MEVDDFKTNICFICTSLFPKLYKVDYSEAAHSKYYIVLLKYLLNAGPPDANNEENSQQQLLISYIFNQLEDTDTNNGSVTCGGIQFCSRCTQLSKDLWSLRRDLEAIQIKLYDKLKVIHQTVELGSKFLNKTDLSSTSTSETRFNEMRFRFQNYVSNSVEWLTRLEPDLWTNEVLTVDDILKEEPTDSVINEMEVDDFFDFDHTPEADISEPVEVENTVTKPKRKPGRPKKSFTPSSFYPLDVSKHADKVHNSILTPSDPLQIEPTKPIKRGWGRPKRIIVPSRPPSENDHEIDANVKQDLTAENNDEDTSTAQSKLKSELELKANIKSSTSIRKRKRKAIRRLYPKRTCPKKYKGPYIKRSDFLKCEPCQFKTNRYSTMEAHLRIQHETPTKSFNCSDCSLGFTTEKLYTVHMYYHKHAVKCEICSERVVVLEMKKHLEEIHQKQEVFSCPGCSYVYSDFINLIHHKADRHAGLSLPCMLCPEATSQDPEICQNRQKLYTHLYHVHNMKHILLKCDEPNCFRTFFDMKSKNTHTLTHSVKIKCPDCDSVYATKYGLDNHIRLVHKKLYDFHCESCSESFANNVQLHRHQIDAHGAPKVQCELCDRDFMTKKSVAAHQRKVHGIGLDKHIEKKIDCPICAKSYTTTTLLKRHMYMHSDVKNFACEICGFLTKRQSLLTNHMKIHAEIKQHACPHCPKRFAKLDALKQHIRVHTGERPYQCDECGAAFNQRTSMMIHKRKHKPDGSFVPRGPRKNKSKEETQTQLIDQTQTEDNLQIPVQSVDIP